MEKYQAFSQNSEFFENLLNDIRKARSRIYLETYIFRNDDLGKKIKDILTQKAQEGISVKLLIDAVGSLAITELDFYDLISSGGDVRFFRRLLLMPFHLAKFNNRNHRKIAVIDHEVSYVGSANIDEKTVSWREFNLRIQSPELNKSLAEIFIRQFIISNSLMLDAEEAKKVHKIEGIEILRAVPFVFHPVRKAFLDMISCAKQEIIIENPYVVFDGKMARVFKMAIERKVKVTLIIPTRSDVNLMNYVNLKFMKKARKMGIKVLYHPGMLHSKIIWVDRKKWMFGSANLEYRSMFTQFEIMLKGEEGEVNYLIKTHLEKSLDESYKNGREFNGKTSLKETLIGDFLYLIRFIF